MSLVGDHKQSFIGGAAVTTCVVIAALVADSLSLFVFLIFKIHIQFSISVLTHFTQHFFAPLGINEYFTQGAGPLIGTSG